MSQYDNLCDSRIAACIRANLSTVDMLANELRRRGWTVILDTTDISTIEGAQLITTCKITKTHIEELN